MLPTPKPSWLPHQAKYLAFFNVGDAEITDTNPRAMSLPGWFQQRYSFYDLVQQYLVPLYQKGFRRFVLEQCFGSDPVTTWTTTLNGFPKIIESTLAFNDYLLMQDAAKTFTPYADVLTTFVPAIKGFKATYPDVEVLGYIGTAFGLPAFDGLDTNGIAKLAWQCLKPYIDAGFDGLIFDSACMLPTGHWLFDVFARLKNVGIRCLVESSPWRSIPTSYGFFSALDQQRNVGTNPLPVIPSLANGGFPGFSDPAKIRGERMGFLAQAKAAAEPDTFSWLCDVLPRAFNAGQIDSIAIAAAWFLFSDFGMQDKTLADLAFLQANTTDANYGAYLDN